MNTHIDFCTMPPKNDERHVIARVLALGVVAVHRGQSVVRRHHAFAFCNCSGDLFTRCLDHLTTAGMITLDREGDIQPTRRLVTYAATVRGANG